jgi:transcriptional regulator with XRE-family HTH domain
MPAWGRIRRARLLLKLGQVEVAARFGIPRSAVSLIETGKRDVSAVLRRSDVGISKFDLPGAARHFGVSVQAVFVGLARLRLVSWELARRADEDPGIRDEILRVGGEVVLQPRRLRRLGFRAYRAGRLTKARLVELLELSPYELEEYSSVLGGRKLRGFKIGVLPR